MKNRFLVGSFRLTFVSMLVAILCYAFTMGFLTAAVFVSLLFVHEMGHVWFAKWRRVSVSIPVFIPFVGALIAIDERELDTPQNEAWIGLGGPLVGGVFAQSPICSGGRGFPNLLKSGVG